MVMRSMCIKLGILIKRQDNCIITITTKRANRIIRFTNSYKCLYPSLNNSHIPIQGSASTMLTSGCFMSRKGVKYSGMDEVKDSVYINHLK